MSRLNRSESGSSIMSQVAANANQIDQQKIERMLSVFNLMQKSESMMSIILIAMREVK